MPPAGNANYAWIQHMIHHLAPNGKIGLVLANVTIIFNFLNAYISSRCENKILLFNLLKVCNRTETLNIFQITILKCFKCIRKFLNIILCKISLANGALSSQSSGEGEIRKRIIQDDLVEGIVALPTQLFYSVTIPVTLWFISKNKKQKGKTLLFG